MLIKITEIPNTWFTFISIVLDFKLFGIHNFCTGAIFEERHGMEMRREKVCVCVCLLDNIKLIKLIVDRWAELASKQLI